MMAINEEITATKAICVGVRGPGLDTGIYIDIGKYSRGLVAVEESGGKTAAGVMTEDSFCGKWSVGLWLNGTLADLIVKRRTGRVDGACAAPGDIDARRRDGAVARGRPTPTPSSR